MFCFNVAQVLHTGWVSCGMPQASESFSKALKWHRSEQRIFFSPFIEVWGVGVTKKGRHMVGRMCHQGYYTLFVLA
jgi:hypothetical protein